MGNTKYSDFKARSYSTGPALLGLLLIGAGIVSILSPFVLNDPDSLVRSLVVGGVAVLLGAIAVSAYKGTLLDLEARRVNNYSSFLGIKFGKWTALPPVSKVAVVPASYKTTNTPNGISPTWSGTVIAYKIILCAANTAASPSFSFADRARAVAEAEKLAGSLQVPCDIRVEKEFERR
ncbi:hypothetical protein ACMA1I_03885 [Pontibacter sp. 13R65]|uniref:hypothetical protein n=1 Tax=Pontibacter sp. 13R65 TaxID=3127458 RepID=UPI00301C1B7C